MLCDDQLKERIRRNLALFDLRRVDPGVHRVAAVAVAIVEEGKGARLEGVTAPDRWSRDAALLLTRRALGLRNHPNQLSESCTVIP